MDARSSDQHCPSWLDPACLQRHHRFERDVAGEVESDWMVPLLLEEERDRLMAWQLGVSL